ncbi:hypothetical protein P3S68_014162 [Capsicum galapagoense]
MFQGMSLVSPRDPCLTGRNIQQDCFKASWSSHKSIHLKGKLSSLATETPTEQNASSPSDSWKYCLRKGQDQTSKILHFNLTGTLRPYPISKKRVVYLLILIRPEWANDKQCGDQI